MEEEVSGRIPCGDCMDGRCGFCLHGWPAMPRLDCGCHTIENKIGGACAKCGHPSTVSTITGPNPGDMIRVEWCPETGCEWEKVVEETRLDDPLRRAIEDKT